MIFRKLVCDLKTADCKFLWEYKESTVIAGVENSVVMKECCDDINRRFMDGVPTRPLLMVPWTDGTALTERMSASPFNMKVRPFTNNGALPSRSFI